ATGSAPASASSSTTTISSPRSGSARAPSRHGPSRTASSRAGITTLTPPAGADAGAARSGGRRVRPRARRASATPAQAACRRVNAARRTTAACHFPRALGFIRPVDWPVSQEETPVDLNDTPEQAEYRAKVRAWLREHRDEAPVLRGEDAIQDEDEAVAAHRAWQRKLAEAGFAGVTW